MTATRYDKLISRVRLRETGRPGRNLETEIHSDKGRIITSTSFRRLQTKAQVFSLERNAAIRTRLTHTLEVAAYGQWIAREAFSRLVNDNLIGHDLRFSFITTVENACLLHDIGNPPFGHLGEYAVQNWFIQREKFLTEHWGNEYREHYSAFKYFNGNPQGFRIVTRLQWLLDSYGLNLTCSLLASMIKYLSTEPDSSHAFAKKSGFFKTESDRVMTIWRHLGLQTKNGLPLQRHPLTYIMEAADDIAYCVSDIEDALEKRIFTESKFFEESPDELRDFIPEPKADYSAFRVSRDSDFIQFKVRLIGRLVEIASEQYVRNHEDILNGTLSQPLLSCDSFSDTALRHLKYIASKYIYPSKEAVDVELSGYRILQDILDAFEPLIYASVEDFDKLRQDTQTKPSRSELIIERRLASLLPEKHFLCYKHLTEEKPEYESIYRTQLIVDYVSGMTDSHAVKIFNMVKGTAAGVNM